MSIKVIAHSILYDAIPEQFNLVICGVLKGCWWVLVSTLCSGFLEDTESFVRTEIAVIDPVFKLQTLIIEAQAEAEAAIGTVISDRSVSDAVVYANRHGRLDGVEKGMGLDSYQDERIRNYRLRG
ncbi:MAG: hypothetical protein MMC33_010106 [Icmadophila ericetorum]|nr:hypothetical protein [Icmadophila ericetorum]